MAKRKYSSEEIVHKLREADVMRTRGVPERIRSDNSPEMIAAKTLRRWLGRWVPGACTSPPAPETAYAKPLIAEAQRAP